MSSKIQNYTRYRLGIDYILESINDGIEKNKFHMTGYGGNIKRHDYILLRDGLVTTQYLVEEIDYYCNPPEMWIALLCRCD